jgi:acyl carrier protein
VDQLRSWLIETLRGLATGFDGPIDEGTFLADGGLCLDSIGLLDLVAALEERTGLEVSEDEITETNFGTVGRLLRFVAARA